MKAVKIDGANRSFGAPEGWNEETDGPCDALPVLDDGKVLQSAWLPEADELAALNAGQPVVLTIFGRGHPAVSVGVLAAPPAEQLPRDNQICADMLQLVSVDATPEAVATWTDGEVVAAEEWAAAVHLRAGDNDEVVIPPMPAHVARLKPVP